MGSQQVLKTRPNKLFPQISAIGGFYAKRQNRNSCSSTPIDEFTCLSPRNLTLAPGEDGQGDPVDADVVDAPHETSPHIEVVIVVIHLGTEVDLGIGAEVEDVVESRSRTLGVNSIEFQRVVQRDFQHGV